MPRRPDGVWTDAQGNPLYYTDPNDPLWRTAPEMEFRDGRWVSRATGVPSLMRDDLPRETRPGSNAFVWPDGTPVSDADKAEISHQAAGNPPSPGATDYGVHGSYDLTGALDSLLPADAPGAELGTAGADESRQRMQAYLQQLQGQAQTGGGAWEQALSASTREAAQGAQALGQSTPGVEAMAARRGIANAQAGVRQRAAGTAEELRAQTRQVAQRELDATLGAQGATDAAQAAEVAAARQARREANAAIYEQAAAKNERIIGAVGQTMATAAGGLSSGGAVPGAPVDPGDSPDNDTVPAWLSPGEVVIPRSVVAQGPDAARDFVAAIQRRGALHFDVGGPVPAPAPVPGGRQPAPWRPDPTPVPTQGPVPVPAPAPSQTQAPVPTPVPVEGPVPLPSSALPGVTPVPVDGPVPLPASAQPPTPGPTPAPSSQSSDPTARGQNAGLFGFGAPQIAADIAHGGLLDTAAYDSTRAAAMANADDFIRAYGGQGPSVAGAQRRAAFDDTMAAAMAAQAGMRGAGRAAGAGNVQSAAGQALQGDAAKAGRTVAGETIEAGHAYAMATQRQRQQDLALAMAQQKAAWRNSMMNAGIGIAAQNQVLGDALSDLDWGGSDDNESDANPFDDADGAATGGEVAEDGVLPPGYVGAIQPGETPEEAAARLGGVYVDRPPAQVATESAAAAAQRALYGTGPAVPTGRAAWAAALGDAQPHGQVPVASETPALAPQTSVPVSPPQLPSTPTPAAVPQRQAAPRSVGAPSAPAKPKEDFFGQERAAATQMGELQAQAAREAADAQAAYVDQVQAHQRAAAEKQVRAKEESERYFSAIQTAREEMKSINMTVDPGRWWATRSTPGKVAAAIGLALGAVGAARDGVNRAVGIIENAVTRDLEAQRAEHELRLRKGQLALESATSIYSLHRQMTQDDLAATSSSKATALELAKAQVDLAAAKIGSPMAKQQAMMLSAQLGQKAQQLDAETKQRSFENYLKREELGIKRQAAGKQDKAGKELIAQVEAEHSTIERAGKQLLELVKKHGTSDLTGPANAQMRQLVDAMAVAAAKLKDPASVAREDEVKMERKNIFEPGVSIENLRGGVEEKIQSYMANAQARRNDAYRVRGLEAPGAEPAQAGGPRPGDIAVMPDGSRIRLSSDGSKWEKI
jgi:hypothetical protein